MPPESPNPPLPPKRTGILPFKGKYFCCNNLPLHTLEYFKNRLDKERNTTENEHPPGPVTGLSNDHIEAAQNVISFLEWAKHWYDATPPLISSREMNIDTVTWFIQVKELKSRRKRFFFPQLGSTPITGVTYSFLEVAIEDLTFPNKEIQKRLVKEVICPYPKEKKFEKCIEHSAPVGLRKGRAFEISAWARHDKKIEFVVPIETSISNGSDDANNEGDEMREMDLKALKEMLVVSDKAEKERVAKEMAAKKGKGKGKERKDKSDSEN
jgi:hypothetical protein